MISLSKRLKTVANFVLKSKSNAIIDVGCDHALLDIYLLQNNDSLRIIASDNKKAPLGNAKKNIEKYSFLNKIELCLKDGIVDMDKNIDTVVISGMGMETIVDILNNGIDELKHVNRLILSSNNKYEDLRNKICKLGFYIKDEKIIYEYKKYYIVIEFVKGIKRYTKKELYFGPILLKNKDELFKNYYSNIKFKKESIAKKIENNDKKVSKLLKEIELLNEEIK